MLTTIYTQPTTKVLVSRSSDITYHIESDKQSITAHFLILSLGTQLAFYQYSEGRLLYGGGLVRKYYTSLNYGGHIESVFYSRIFKGSIEDNTVYKLNSN